MTLNGKGEMGMKEFVEGLMKELTLEEKAGLCSGLDFWHTKPVERLEIPSVMLSDGPHGLRKQDMRADHLGINNSIVAVCFPTACATAASFDKELVYRIGVLIGEECQAEDVSVVLGPAVNIKRSPLCGRNFEYFSEDPCLTSELATNYIQGVQSQGVGTSIKHFLANNQEHRRMTSDSVIDERTLREIYLAAFEKPVRQGKPKTVMCSYNKVNGEQVSESYHFMTEVLRKEWGFDGYVVSDWGAVADRVKGLAAGLDLEMPSSGGKNDAIIVEAVKSGILEEAVLDQAVERILTHIYDYKANKKEGDSWDRQVHHRMAREFAAECIVLLKNEAILPLKNDTSIGFIGAFAEKPRYQGGGSSHINSYKELSALEAVSEYAQVEFAKGYEVSANCENEVLLMEAVELAKKVEVAVLFVGLPDEYESEGYDRKHMQMPECQNKLIEAVASVQPNTIVVLHNGSPVEMPWADKVKGIVEVYLGGEAVGGATVDILFGKKNPSGKLPESIPFQLEDNPSYLFYGGEKDLTEYREGVFVGYRYYDKKKMKVRYPFGFGLSYTQFAYSNLKVNKKHLMDTDTVTVSVEVSNIGTCDGKEVVQLYVGDIESTVFRPIRELKGFEKVFLQVGETKTVSFELGKRDFAYYNVQLQDWHVESGEFRIEIGRSSANIECSQVVYVESTQVLPIQYDYNSTFGDIMKDPRGPVILAPLVELFKAQMSSGDAEESNSAKQAISDEMTEAMLGYMPIRQLLSFGQGNIGYEEIDGILDMLNQRS